MQSNPTLTIFTPSFNRAYCLNKCYDSLCRQSLKDFCWLVIDDGSKDNTRELVDGWIRENKISISYIYQANLGMHGAHNAAYRIIDTEINTCIDSDDYMPDDAVEKIVSFWKENGSKKYAGFVGLDQTEGGSIIGQKFPEGMNETTLLGYYESGGSGDKKLVYRTDIITRYPEYPIFKGEKYVGLAYKYYLIDRDYKLLTINEVLCIVDYQPDGSSMNMYRQYFNNPKGFAFYRLSRMMVVSSCKRRFIECIHFVSSSMISRNKSFLKETPFKITTFIAIPFGLALTVFINYKVKKGIQMKKPQ